MALSLGLGTGALAGLPSDRCPRLSNCRRGRPPAHATREHLLIHKDYLTWYDDDLLVPLWVGYKLTKANIIKQQDRIECFRPDPRLPADVTAFCTDYLEKTYDQGHLAPNADFKGTEAMMINTYLYSNMTPQHDTFNRYTWERLESLVRMWVEKRGDLFVITGSVFDQNGDQQRDADNAAQRMAPSNHVAIPTHFYKIVMQKKTFGANDTIAILLPRAVLQLPPPPTVFRLLPSALWLFSFSAFPRVSFCVQMTPDDET